MKLLERLLFWKKEEEDPLFEVEDWNQVVYDRDDLQIHNRKQRQEYVRGCLEQIAEASKEVEDLQYEYGVVTSHLKDMEEIEAIPREDMKLLQGFAKELQSLSKQQDGYLSRPSKMSDEKFHQLERMEEDLEEGYEKLKNAEDYQALIKRDLKKLDNERQAFHYRKVELLNLIEDTKTMTIICSGALVAILVILLILYYGFGLHTKTAALIAMGIGAVAITFIFLKHTESKQELVTVENGISRLIRLQNAVKIRYVNNTHLLNYLYVKYKVDSAEELGKDYKLYQEEREERAKYRMAEMQMGSSQKELLHMLRRYQVQDPTLWLRQTEALLDRKEMVEIRHQLIIRRQSLRRRIDYNKEVVAGKAQDEIKDLVERYPRYAKEIMGIVGEYEKTFT